MESRKQLLSSSSPPPPPPLYPHVPFLKYNSFEKGMKLFETKEHRISNQQIHLIQMYNGIRFLTVYFMQQHQHMAINALTYRS